MIGLIARLAAFAPLRLWALICAGPALTLTGGLMTLVVWRGGWARELQTQQLTLLGWGLLCNWLLLGVVIVALASVRLKGQGPGGMGFAIEGGDDAEAPATPGGRE